MYGRKRAVLLLIRGHSGAGGVLLLEGTCTKATAGVRPLIPVYVLIVRNGGLGTLCGMHLELSFGHTAQLSKDA